MFEFTPLEGPAACPVRSSASIGAYNRDEDEIPFGANTGFTEEYEPLLREVREMAGKVVKPRAKEIEVV